MQIGVRCAIQSFLQRHLGSWTQLSYLTSLDVRRTKDGLHRRDPSNDRNPTGSGSEFLWSANHLHGLKCSQARHLRTATIPPAACPRHSVRLTLRAFSINVDSTELTSPHTLHLYRPRLSSVPRSEFVARHFGA